MTKKASALTFPKKIYKWFSSPKDVTSPSAPSSRIKTFLHSFLSYKGYIFIVFR